MRPGGGHPGIALRSPQATLREAPGFVSTPHTTRPAAAARAPARHRLVAARVWARQLGAAGARGRWTRGQTALTGARGAVAEMPNPHPACSRNATDRGGGSGWRCLRFLV